MIPFSAGMLFMKKCLGLYYFQAFYGWSSFLMCTWGSYAGINLECNIFVFYAFEFQMWLLKQVQSTSSFSAQTIFWYLRRSLTSALVDQFIHTVHPQQKEDYKHL